MPIQYNLSSQQAFVESNYNLIVLQNLITQKVNEETSIEKTEKIEQMVMQAAINVFKNIGKDINLYLYGIEEISQSQCEKIENEFQKIKLNLDKKKEYQSIKASLFKIMIGKLRSSDIDAASFESSKPKLLEDYYQIMGCKFAYAHWEKGDIISGPHAKLSDYEVYEVISNKKGLQIIVLKPLDETSAPIICCRGTTKHNLHNLVDDFNKNIGQYSLEDSKEHILTTLQQVAQKYGPVVIAGHSLGGAIAQHLTAEYCDQKTSSGQPLIKSTYLYSAPGPGKEAAEKYEQKRKNLPEDKRPKVFEYYDSRDVVVLAGGSHLKADIIYQRGGFSVFDFLSPATMVRQAHGWSQLISEFKTRSRDDNFYFQKNHAILGRNSKKLSVTNC